MADKMFPILPVGWFISSELNTQEHVAHLNIPKLFIHGTVDGLIPYSLGRKLYESAAQPKEFYAIEGAGHNNTYRVGGRAYFDTIQEFISRTVSAQKTAKHNEPPMNTDEHR